MSREGLKSYKVRWICPAGMMLPPLGSVLLVFIWGKWDSFECHPVFTIDKRGLILNYGS